MEDQDAKGLESPPESLNNPEEPPLIPEDGLSLIDQRLNRLTERVDTLFSE